MLAGAQPHLVWGEVRLPVKTDFLEMERIGAKVRYWMNSLDQLALATLGRPDEIDRTRYPTPAGLDLARTDLRYSPNGPDFFQRAGLQSAALPGRVQYTGVAIRRPGTPRPHAMTHQILVDGKVVYEITIPNE